MTVGRLIYLDNGATSWPKPKTVIEAISRFYNEVGVAAGRGSSTRSSQVDRTIDICRTELAYLINAKSNQIIFCFNGTDGLNLTLHGLIAPGDHVVTSVVEHNSVLRPLNQLAKRQNVKLNIVNCLNGEIDLDELDAAVTKSTRLVCVSHVSNVTGIAQNIERIAAICREAGALLVVDAAQSVGHIPVDFQQLSCDALVASGHKGLLGPLGTGFVCLSSRAAAEIVPTRLGGTGTNSESTEQPWELPYRLEAGNLNVGGIFGLLEGVRYLKSRTIENVADHELELANYLISNLGEIENVQLYGCAHENRTGVVSLNVADQDPQSVAALLDSEFGIHVRSGLHCAPLMHQSLGSFDCGGTVRISPGIFNTSDDIKSVVSAITQISSQLV